MTALFEMRIRVGSDPGGFTEFAALLEELAKLNHPACPDVDWGRVEQLSLALFQQNGADLHSAAAFVLARSRRHGLEGMAQGIGLLDALGCEWPSVWPLMPSLRLEILTWLFAQMQSLLRSLPMGQRNLPALEHLDTELLRLQLRLNRQMPVAPGTLPALRQQVESVIHRLQRNDGSSNTLHLSSSAPEPILAMPAMIWSASPMPEIKLQKSHGAGWLCALVVMLLIAGGVWWGAGSNSLGEQRFASLFQQKQPMPAPVRLDSLALFAAGSSELKPGSTKVLISTLVDIRAQPGWLIVISGHSDDRGSPEQNRQLSDARAWAVRNWMQRMADIPDSCFAVQGVAASQPIATNETEAGRAANRRVDISLVPQAGACA
jgi:type VI secretion system protein VasL